MLENKAVDTGCRYYPRCLDCPYETCIEDMTFPNAETAMKRGQARELKAKGYSTEYIAERIGTSVRTAERYLATTEA